MPIVSSPEQFHEEDLYVDLAPTFGVPIFLKCEGFNFAGSVKHKAATAMVDAAECAGLIRTDSILIESSSGNLGVALSMIAASRGYQFVCVTDARCNLTTRRIMEAFGAHVYTVTGEDPHEGLLAARIAYVRRRCSEDSRFVWLNQYENLGNWQAHYMRTAPAIARQFPDVDVVFIGAGTTGTLMGCARWFREHQPGVRIIAVDSVGSVIFGGEPAPRLIPGLGSAIRPPMLDESLVDDIRHVPEIDTLRMCHRLASRGFLFGGSTGTVITGAVEWLADHGHLPGRIAVAIAPDLGERYLDTIYRMSWVSDAYGADVLARAGTGEPFTQADPARLT